MATNVPAYFIVFLPFGFANKREEAYDHNDEG
jgi:hypothetical protein